MELPGAVDMHVHFGPSPLPPEYSWIPISVTAVETAREAADAGFAAIVLKAKDSCTAGLAHAVQEVVPGVRVLGGLVLDYPAGGLNPVAVEQALLLGAKVIWLPTTGSLCDCMRNGLPPGVAYAAMEGDAIGIPVIDDAGKPLPAVHQIFELVEFHDAVLATGHIGLEEHFAIGREFGASGRILATHVGNHGGGPRITVDQCADLAALGVVMEFTPGTCKSYWSPTCLPVAEHVAMMRAAGVHGAVLSSDYGWTGDMPRPVAGIHEYYDLLLSEGFTEDELHAMACETPARLLGLET